jgi:hypothetical protein
LLRLGGFDVIAQSESALQLGELMTVEAGVLEETTTYARDACGNH